MSGPGSGRYTKFVPPASPRNALLARLFNERAPDGKGAIYGSAYQTSLKDAAAAAVATATAKVNSTGVGGLIPSDGLQTGDSDMFPGGTRFGFLDSPDIGKDVEWKNPGDPANAYTPDISSPGPGKTDGVDKDKDPNVSIQDVKGEKYVPGAPGTGTTSPSKTGPNIGTYGIGKPIVMGKSSI